MKTSCTIAPNKEMKKSLISCFMLFTAIIFAQNIYGQLPENRMERFQTQKIAFFTDKLKLTPAEAEKFWPVYNDYTSRKDKLDEEIRSIMRFVARNSDNMSDKEIKESTDNYIRLQEESHRLFLDYHNKYQQILPPGKVMKIYITENQFKAVLLNQIRENRPARAPVRR